jgi:phage/plasmid-like protein (TIGR03299 family)
VVDQFDRTLIGGAAAIYDVGQHELGIGSAGLLRGGAVAWISMELPEAVQTPEGFTYRPTATLIDSYNGQFKFGVYYYKISVVCDNGLLETQNRANLSYTRKHTSRLDIAEARSALKVFWKNDEEFQKQIKALAQWEVTNKQFKAVMDEVVPMPAPIVDDGKVKNQRSITNAETKRAELEYLWVDDIRAATWNGTALGVWQAFNTWDTHFSQIRGSTDSEGNKIEANRTQRNMLRVARGYQMENDTLVLDTLATVCDVDLSEVFAYN